MRESSEEDISYPTRRLNFDYSSVINSLFEPSKESKINKRL